MVISVGFLSGCNEQTALEQENKSPTASCSANPMSGTEPLIVYFTGSGSDTDGNIVSYYWNFGDGETSSSQSSYHTYESSGTYTVTLTVTDDDGATDSDTIAITVKENMPPEETNILPVAGFSYSYASGYDYALKFLDGSHDPDGYIVARTFDFGDGTTGSGTPAPAQIIHEYSGVGIYTVTLTVEDNDGGLHQKTVTIEITENIEPVAILSAEPTSGQVPLTVDFSAENSYDPDGHIASYKWLYEDIIDLSAGGGFQEQLWATFISYDETFSNTYNYTGSFEVELIVYDNRGAVSNNVTITITVT